MHFTSLRFSCFAAAMLFSFATIFSQSTVKPTPTPEMSDEDAIKAVSEMQQKDYREADKLLGQANALIAQGKDRDALPVLDQARQLNSNDTRIFAAGAIAWMHLGDLEKADQAATYGANSFFAGCDIYVALGQVKRAKKDLAGAIDSYTKAIAKDDGCASAYYQRGIAKAESSDNAGAIADYTKAIELDPKMDDAYFKRGYLYIFVLSQPAKGVADFDKFIALKPNDSYAYSNRSSGYYNLKQFDKALADDNKAIQVWDKNKFAFANRGLIYAQQGNYELAKADYQKALALDPNFQIAKDRLAALEKTASTPKSASNGGTANDNAAKEAETKKLLDGIIGKDQKLTPDTFNAPKDPGKTNALPAYSGSGKYKDAMDAYNAGMDYNNKGETDNALAAFKEAFAMDPKFVVAISNVGAMYGKKNMLAEALDADLRALHIDPNFEVALNNIEGIVGRIKTALNAGTLTLSKQGLTDYYNGRIKVYNRIVAANDAAANAEIAKRSSILDCSKLQTAYEGHFKFTNFLQDLKYDFGRGATTFTADDVKLLPQTEEASRRSTAAWFDRMHEDGCIVRAFDPVF